MAQKITRETMLRVADWHGTQAAKAWRENDEEAYLRHVGIADQLWRKYR